MIEVVRPESVGLCSQRLTRIDEWLQQQIDLQRLAGASVIVGRHGAVGYQGHAGVRTLDNPAPFDMETVVRIYSMTKPITATVAMTLVQEGRLGLDDEVADGDRFAVHLEGKRLNKDVCI